MKKSIKNALIIVDVQNDFLPPQGTLAIKGGDSVVAVINSLQNKFMTIIATKDWHPPHHCSFASEHGKKPGEIVEINGCRQELWPIHCVQGTTGAEFSPLLKTEMIAKTFYKGIDPDIDSYSAFFDNAHQRSTGLGEYLKEHWINEITIVGLATDYCVKYSVQDAIKLGFAVTVVIDGCRGINLQSGDIEKALKEMEAEGARMMTSEALLFELTQLETVEL